MIHVKLINVTGVYSCNPGSFKYALHSKALNVYIS
jgi:hypothetical protein